MWRYHNPVEIAFGVDVFDRLPELIAGRRAWAPTVRSPAGRALLPRLSHVNVTIGTSRNYARVPRFYIDVRDPCAAATDDEGVELPDLDTACRESVVTAAQILKELGPCNEADVVLTIRD